MNAGATLQPRPTQRPIHQWEYLSPGDGVEVCLGDLQYAGWVDAVGDRGHLIYTIKALPSRIIRMSGARCPLLTQILSTSY